VSWLVILVGNYIRFIKRAMIKNYFKVIIQNLIRNKTYSFINILGLSTGLAACLIILQYVRFEHSYDRFHSKGEDIYRVILEMNSDGNVTRDAANFAPTSEALKNDFPEVKNYVRITPEYGRVVLAYSGKAFEEKKVYYADSTWFTFFDFKLLAGNPKTALKEPGSIVLSMASAEKYFGPEDSWKQSPLNQIIVLNNSKTLTITGIMDAPANSHIQYDALISFTTFVQQHDPSKEWGWNDFYTYIELAPGTDPKVFESKLPAFVLKYKGKDAKDKMILQPLTDIHLHSNVGFELSLNGSAQTVYFLSIISILILIIAWVNYVNLSTAKSEHRAKEIGVRKVNGAHRGQLMIQFLLESFCMNFIALVLAIAIVTAVLPIVGHFLDKPLKLSLLHDQRFLIYTGFLYVSGSVLSGLYPAIILSGFKPVAMFKSSPFNASGRKSPLRQSLVIFQFIMSASLITGTLIIQNQMEFVKKSNLGFDYTNRLVLNVPASHSNDSIFSLSYQRLKQELLKYPEIEAVTISSALPGKSYNDIDMRSVKMVGQKNDHENLFSTFKFDEDFIDVFQLKLIEGKNFYGNRMDDKFVLINRKGAEVLGFSSPENIVGKMVSFGGETREVIGVLENYHHKSLKNNFEPMIVRNKVQNMLYVTLRMVTNRNVDLENVIHNVQQRWSTLYPGDPFIYNFMDEHIHDQYKADIQFSRIFGIFSGFSIFISCLGLFGLVSYSVSVRIKEIGVRKVLGASVASIVMLFTRDYFKLLMIAFIIGLPLSNYVINLWVENFAYRAPVGWWLFIVPVCFVSILALCASTIQILKASLTNPVNCLRHE
jgi:putative ABC transport system permease protein